MEQLREQSKRLRSSSSPQESEMNPCKPTALLRWPTAIRRLNSSLAASYGPHCPALREHSPPNGRTYFYSGRKNKPPRNSKRSSLTNGIAHDRCQPWSQAIKYSSLISRPKGELKKLFHVGPTWSKRRQESTAGTGISSKFSQTMTLPRGSHSNTLCLHPRWKLLSRQYHNSNCEDPTDQSILRTDWICRDLSKTVTC